MAAKELHNYTIKLAAPETEFDQGFVQGMANRVAVSYHKYGPMADGFGTDSAKNTDAIATLKLHLEAYAKDGNTEHMMDMANYAMIEYKHPSHPNAHFEATDSTGSPGRVRGDGSVDQARNG